jgi:hypothetical protein
VPARRGDRTSGNGGLEFALNHRWRLRFGNDDFDFSVRQ